MKLNPLDHLKTKNRSLRFQHKKNYVRFLFTSSCLQEDACACLLCVCSHVVVSGTCCVFFPSSCVPYVASFSGLFFFDCPFGFIKRLIHTGASPRTFNFTFRYIDDVLSLTNSNLDDLLIASISWSLKSRIPQILLDLLYTLTYTSEVTVRTG